jgi:hypothetical protein
MLSLVTEIRKLAMQLDDAGGTEQHESGSRTEQCKANGNSHGRCAFLHRERRLAMSSCGSRFVRVGA